MLSDAVLVNGDHSMSLWERRPWWPKTCIDFHILSNQLWKFINVNHIYSATRKEATSKMNSVNKKGKHGPRWDKINRTLNHTKHVEAQKGGRSNLEAEQTRGRDQHTMLYTWESKKHEVSICDSLGPCTAVAAKRKKKGKTALATNRVVQPGYQKRVRLKKECKLQEAIKTTPQILFFMYGWISLRFQKKIKQDNCRRKKINNEIAQKEHLA